jgi:paraquat-inducible protein B
VPLTISVSIAFGETTGKGASLVAVTFAEATGVEAGKTQALKATLINHHRQEAG